jgi:hypothetical protein
MLLLSKLITLLKIFVRKIAHRGGNHDITVFREDGLKAKMLSAAPGKMANGDRGYVGEAGIMATPNANDHPALAKFKSRVRCRHDTFNGRLKFFSWLE